MDPPGKKNRSQSPPPANTMQESASTSSISLPPGSRRQPQVPSRSNVNVSEYVEPQIHEAMPRELHLKGLQSSLTGPTAECTRNTLDREPRERICRWTPQTNRATLLVKLAVRVLRRVTIWRLTLTSHNETPNLYQLHPLHTETLHNQATPDERVHATLPSSASC